ncbi:branched-chain amino acid ABC transporter permease [Streptomyces sp. M2CJ-2]|uniref:branched-chain amino acid ABC transporter permease n=1 Tax=Streptomyces sp. M2CJ-2 TaxID=2803948 RepID=UPI00192745F7|nr:branched-chain amino acid ABC transporter permease [Streptomyces sp. M2CJ-2]MBL3668045.1 branched-chain amino acid ABC transporter permease [Streptomyces sp. M2CJ-2]
MTQAEIFQALVSGLALGAGYALLAVGVVVVYSATGILNFAQGAFVLIGAFTTYQVGVVWGLPFLAAALASLLVGALLSMLTGMTLLRRFSKKAHFPAVMATVGLLFLVQALVAGLWGDEARDLGDPWGLRVVEVGGSVLALSDVWTAATGAVLLVAVFALIRFSPIGLAMRAAVSDEEAAVAQGISTRTVTVFAWSLGGALGAVAGILLAAGASGVNSTLGIAAFAALPAMVLGGIDSPMGALLGGLFLGVAQQFAILLQSSVLEPLGAGFPGVLPYLILVVMLVVRPQGFFGTRAVRRF